MKCVFKIAFLVTLFFTFGLQIHAQIPTSIDGVEVNLSPTYPKPGQNVRISIESYTTDLNSASVIWIVDSKNTSQGTGIKSINVTAPNTGKKMNVSVIVKTIEGVEVRKDIVIKTGDVDLVWESEGYVPPLFEGKSLFSYQNILKIVAIPHLSGSNGQRIDPLNLVYKWKVNDKAVQNQSGFGKQTLTLIENLPKTLEIEVFVNTKDGLEEARQVITLEPEDSKILFYEEDPLYGVLYNKAIEDRLTLNKQEVSILAVPYFFSSLNKASSLEYNWSINGIAQADTLKNRSITLRTKGDTEGSSYLSLDVVNKNKILQGAKSSLSLFFNKIPKVEENNVF